MGTERAVTDAWVFFDSKWQCVAAISALAE